MRQIEQLVNQQVLRWTEEQRLASRPPPPRADTPRPVICISRQFGAQAGELAQEVAAHFNFSVCDQDLVEQVARQAHVRRRVVESLDERVQTGIQQWVDELIELNRFRPSDYLRNLSEVVLAMGRHGRSVIIGRGAHVILDPAYTLRVRCYAPFAWRSQQVAARHGLSLARAESLTLRVDAERSAFYREHFDADVADPLRFDLLLNVSTMPLETRSAIVAAAFEAKFPEYARAPVSGIRHALANETPEQKAG
jgi:cytidylate kinase